MMKKLLAIALALVLIYALSVTAVADITLTPPSPEGTWTPPSPSAQTDLSLSIDPSYTVTIPELITLDPVIDSSNNITGYQETATISATNVRLEAGYGLNVKLLASNFQLTTTDGSATLDYKVTFDEDNTDVIGNDAIVATFHTQTAPQSVTLYFSADNPQYAGTYTGTVNFTLSVVEIPNT